MVKKIVNLVGGALMCATLAANAQEEQPGPFSQGVSLITAVVQQTIPILLPIAEALAPAAEDTDEAIYMMMPGLGRKLLQRMEMPMPPVPPPQEEMMTDMEGPVEGLIAREAGPIAEALRALGSAPIGSFFETLFNQTLPAIGAALATPPTVTPVLTTGGPTASG